MGESIVVQAINEVIAEDMKVMREFIAEEIKPLLNEAKRIRDARFNREYKELKRLEEEAR